jgi:thiol-disulfide isomerase/thioredoxin
MPAPHARGAASARCYTAPVLQVLGLCGLLAATLAGAKATAREGDELLGTRPPEWQVTGWLNSPPLRLAELRGRAVLVRWWTGPECPFCRASAPALRRLREIYGDRGLVVVGFYHHKSRARLDPDRVAALAAEMGYDFPVAIDPEWRTLRRWWLDGADRGFTSVSFLLDRGGAVRWIHPGGEIGVGGAQWNELLSMLEEIL